MKMTQQPPGPIITGVYVQDVVNRVSGKEKVQNSLGESEGKRQETVQSDCSSLICFIFSYKLHCLSCPNEYLMGICCFICMLYNLSPYNHNFSREAAEPPILSPTLSVLPEVPLNFLRREQGKKKKETQAKGYFL